MRAVMLNREGKAKEARDALRLSKQLAEMALTAPETVPKKGSKGKKTKATTRGKENTFNTSPLFIFGEEFLVFIC